MTKFKGEVNKDHPRNKIRTPEQQSYRDDLYGAIDDIRAKKNVSDINTPQILLKLDQSGGENKFVHMLDQDGREYLIALSIREYGLHANVVDLCKRLFKKDFSVLGGGYIKKEGSSLKLYGKSDVFGEANMSRVKILLEKEFPNENVVYDGREKHFDLETERSNIKKPIENKETETQDFPVFLSDDPRIFKQFMEREAKKGLGKDYLHHSINIYSSINLSKKIERLNLDEGSIIQCLNEYGPKLGYDHIDQVVFPQSSSDIGLAVRSVENGIDYGYSSVYLVWEPKTDNYYHHDFLLFKEIANTKDTKDYLSIENVVLDKKNDILKLTISTGGSFGGTAMSKNIEINLQKELDPRTEETNRFKIEKEYNGFTGKERINHIINDLKDKGYLCDLFGKEMHFLDLVEHDQEAILEKLERQKLPTWVINKIPYEKPKAKNLKIVVLKFDPNKHGNDITKEKFFEEMKKMGLRPASFEEYLQFASSNSKYLKSENGGYLYSPEIVVSKEGYRGPIQAHQNGFGIDIGGRFFYKKMPFVIEE